MINIIAYYSLVTNLFISFSWNWYSSEYLSHHTGNWILLTLYVIIKQHRECEIGKK